jgi:hypothetical protein
MSRFSLTTSIVLIATSLPVATLSAEEGRPLQSPELRERVLKKFDKNGNGQLDPDERQAAKEAMEKRQGESGGLSGTKESAQQDPDRMKRILEAFDLNKDGKLDDAERAAAKAEREKRRGQAPASAGRGPASEKMRDEMLKRFDRDGDGKLSDAERAAAKEERQKRRQE